MYKTLSITLLSHRIRNDDFSNCFDAFAFANKPFPAIWKQTIELKEPSLVWTQQP